MIFTMVLPFYFSDDLQKKLGKFLRQPWYPKNTLNYPFSALLIFPIFSTLGHPLAYPFLNVYSTFPNYLFMKSTNIKFYSYYPRPDSFSVLPVSFPMFLSYKPCQLVSLWILWDKDETGRQMVYILLILWYIFNNLIIT